MNAFGHPAARRCFSRSEVIVVVVVAAVVGLPLLLLAAELSPVRDEEDSAGEARDE